MQGTVHIVDRLERVARRLLLSGDADDLLVATGILAMRGASSTFEEGVGLARDWRIHLAWQIQQVALREILKSCPARSALAVAKQAATLLKRYQTGAWTRDQREGRRPDGVAGWCHDYINAGGAVSCESIRRRIGNRS